MAPLYLLEAVRKAYDGRQALEVPSLAIPEGTFCSLTGPNGSGKSTLLGILAFLCPPSAGAVYFDGERVDWRERSLGPLRKEVTLLHQSPYLFEGSVGSNVAYGLRVRGIGGEAGRRRVKDALETVGLSGFGERRARAWSGGEMQRVALARALAISPRVLLLDEPLAGVDRESAELIRRVVYELPRRGTTVIAATHDPHGASRPGAMRLRLEGGRLLSPVAACDDGEDSSRGDAGHARL